MMPGPPGPPPILQDGVSLEQLYPQLDGYDEFVAQHSKELEALCALSDDNTAIEFMQGHLELLQGSGHVGHWVAQRHIATLQSGAKAGAVLNREARMFFLMDAACDAANACFLRKYGTQHASSEMEVLAAAAEGTTMLKRALSIPGDPMQMNMKLKANVSVAPRQQIPSCAIMR
jgi:hypothetical protein